MAEQPKRVAFLGVDSLASFENMKWWTLGKSHIHQYKSEDKPDRIDVFGVGRKAAPQVPHPCGPPGVEQLAPGQPIWMTLPPKYYDRVVASNKVVTDSLRAGKAVFVESLEYFDKDSLQQIFSLATATDAPVFMTGLYQRFDSQLSQAAELGIENMVGRPLLYQAHASTLDESMFDLGMQHVDAVRFLLRSEPMEVFASGSSRNLRSCEVLALTLKLESGAVASLALDRSGTCARQRVLVIGDQSRAEFEADLLEAPALSARVLRLQKAGVNHFVQAVFEGTAPRMAVSDVLRARAVMVAVEASLRTGQPAIVARDFTVAAAANSWAGQVASKMAELAKKASDQVGSPLEGGQDTIPAQQAGTPPRKTKGAHIGTQTPDSPELLQHPSRSERD